MIKEKKKPILANHNIWDRGRSKGEETKGKVGKRSDQRWKREAEDPSR